ncbi:MAG TPA: zf-HC2 domain-containing protein [Planctomycetota bacterium]|jgi:hypothetical protein
MLDCASCAERLPDFLLDELPEREAVLVHEHLNLCENCMRVYREMRGTGKALEAVPSMRPVQGSPEFDRAVRAQAVVELANIVAKLPPDKRLRLEARRAARLSRAIERPQPARRIFTTGLLIAVLAGIVVLGTILLYPRRDPSLQRQSIGTLAIAFGKVEQFYQRPNEPHSAVQAGKSIYAGDSFVTSSDGRARFDFPDETVLFLGPDSRVTLRMQAPGTSNVVMELERGELGVQRPRHGREEYDEEPLAPWEIRSEAGSVVMKPGSHAYLRMQKNATNAYEEVNVLRDNVEVLNRSGAPLATVSYGHRLEFAAGAAAGRSGAIKSARVPAWRMDLVSAADLQRLLAGDVTSAEWQNGALVVSVHYDVKNPKPSQRDWTFEPVGNTPEKSSGLLSVPAGTRARHVIPFCAPLALELRISRDTPGDAGCAFALESTESEPPPGVTVDVGREARLQVRGKDGALRNSSVPVHAPAGKFERLRLDVTSERGGFAAQFGTATDKTGVLQVPKDVVTSKTALWVQGVGDTVTFEEVRITGIVPTEWLRERLSKY